MVAEYFHETGIIHARPVLDLHMNTHPCDLDRAADLARPVLIEVFRENPGISLIAAASKAATTLVPDDPSQCEEFALDYPVLVEIARKAVVFSIVSRMLDGLGIVDPATLADELGRGDSEKN